MGRLWNTNQGFGLRVAEHPTRKLRVGEILAVEPPEEESRYRCSQWVITRIDDKNSKLCLLKLLSRVRAAEVNLLVEATKGIS